MILSSPCALKINPNQIFGYVGDVLLELNGKIDLPVDTSIMGVPCETKSYHGIQTDESNRLGQTIEMIKVWNQFYDRGFKHDLVLIDNSDDEFFGNHYVELSNSMKYTNSFVIHNNRNHWKWVTDHTGEKSALLLPIKFSTGGWSFGMGYKVLLHHEAKYSPDLDFDWGGFVKDFIEKDLDVCVVPSRYNKTGFNHNIMLIKPIIWLLLSKVWFYHAERMNTDLLDCYEAFNQLGYIWTDDISQPYKYCNKEKFKLWVDPPSEWFRQTTEYKFEETETGYIGIKK